MKAGIRKKNFNSNYILYGIILFGVCLLLYPTVSDYWNSFHQSRAIVTYNEQVAKIDNSEFERLWAEAAAYNSSLLETGNRYVMNEEEENRYNSLLNITGTGIMSYIEIPKLGISLPIYHGTEDTILQVAIGHIPGSSLPVGGTSTHCVISGHRGLPRAKLFTEIDRLENGDLFTLETLGETLTYEVDQTRIVLPNELEDIEIEEGQDYCTLVTCTPYGVNSHRLLVRGHRTDNRPEAIHVTSDASVVDYRIVGLVIGAISMVLLTIIFFAASFLMHKAEE